MIADKLEKKRLAFTCKQETSDKKKKIKKKKIANRSPFLLPYNISKILRLKRLLKRRFISRNINFFQKIPSSGLKIICQFVKVDQNVNKPLARALRYIIIKSFFLAIDWTYLYDLSHTFLKIL